MNRKLRNIGWIVLLFVLCVPTGYLIALSDGKFVRGEMIINLIAGSIAMIIVMGMIGLIIWAILKTRKSADPMKPALMTVTVLMILLLIVAAIEYPSAMQRMKRDDFIEHHKDDITRAISESVVLQMTRTRTQVSSVDEVTECVSIFVMYDEDCLDALLENPDLTVAIANSKEIQEKIKMCTEMYAK